MPVPAHPIAPDPVARTPRPQAGTAREILRACVLRRVRSLLPPDTLGSPRPRAPWDPPWRRMEDASIAWCGAWCGVVCGVVCGVAWRGVAWRGALYFLACHAMLRYVMLYGICHTSHVIIHLMPRCLTRAPARQREPLPPPHGTAPGHRLSGGAPRRRETRDPDPEKKYTLK